MNIIRPSYKVLTRIFIGLCLGVLATQAQAEANEKLGRLFSKPNERSNLNVIRQNQNLKVISAQEALQPEIVLNAAPAELSEPITLQGYVKRNDGQKNTLWINGRTVQEDTTVDSVKIGRLNQRGFSKKSSSTEGVDIKIPANGKNIRLKAGQMYEPESNQIYEMQVVEKAKRLNLKRSGTIDDSAE